MASLSSAELLQFKSRRLLWRLCENQNLRAQKKSRSLDLTQAEQLFEVLAEGRQGGLMLAHEAAEIMGAQFVDQLAAV